MASRSPVPVGYPESGSVPRRCAALAAHCSLGGFALALAVTVAVVPKAHAAATTNYANGSILHGDDDRFVQYYNSWKSAFVTSSGANGHLRVRRPEDNNDTVSEGIAYGMLLAVYANDSSTFSGLWNHAKFHHNSRKLMKWQVNSSGSAMSDVCATDADIDMAFALIIAHRKGWGNNYGTDATNLCNAMLAHCVENGSNVLKPGDTWGGSDCTNPSYFATGMFKAFADHTGNSRWNDVRNKCYEILNNVNQKNNNTGLVPNWCKADGNQVTAISDRTYHDGSDACRMPWRLAMDFAWFGDNRAKTHLDRVNAFFAGVGAYNIKGDYWINGSEKVSWGNVQWRLAPIAAGAIASNNGTFRSQMWSRVLETQHDTGYYGRSLQVLGIMFASGVMRPPSAFNGGGGGGGGGGPNPITVYGDSLASDWSNWSWSTSVDFNSTAQVRVGSRSTAVTFNGGWAGFSLRKGTAIGTSGYSSIKFWVHGGSGSNKSLRVWTQSADSGGDSSAVTVTATAGQWNELTVNLSSLGNPGSIKRINIQNNSGSSQSVIYIDESRVSP